MFDNAETKFVDLLLKIISNGAKFDIDRYSVYMYLSTNAG